jgi:hypothetical protein
MFKWKILAITLGKTYSKMAIGDDAHFYALCMILLKIMLHILAYEK